jgi:hypothetical protein
MAKDNTNTNKRNTASVPQHEPGTQVPLFQRRYFNPKDLKANHGQCPGIPENPRFIRDNKYKALLKSMVEFEPIYFDVIIKRWEELTGSKAVLIRNIHDNEKKETKEESDNAKG